MLLFLRPKESGLNNPEGIGFSPLTVLLDISELQDLVGLGQEPYNFGSSAEA